MNTDELRDMTAGEILGVLDVEHMPIDTLMELSTTLLELSAKRLREMGTELVEMGMAARGG